MASSHPWQEKRRKVMQKRQPQIRLRSPRTFVLIAGQFFGAVRTLSGTEFLMAVRALLNSFFGGAVRGFSDLTSSHPWQEKKGKKSEAAAAEKVEEPKDLCSHSFFLAVRALFFLRGWKEEPYHHGCKSLMQSRFFGCKSLIFFLGGGGWL